MSTKIIASLFLLITLVSGCTTSSRDPLVGKWKGIDDQDGSFFKGKSTFVELSDDGTFSFKIEVARGNWTVLADGRLELDDTLEDSNEETYVVQFSIEGDKLTAIDPDGEVQEYMQVR